MSRNTKYYVKKLDKSAAKGCQRLDSLFSRPSTSNTDTGCQDPIVSDSSNIETSQSVHSQSESKTLHDGDETCISTQSFAVTEVSESSDDIQPCSSASLQDFCPPFTATKIPGHRDDQTPIKAAKRPVKRPLSVDYESQFDWLYYNSSKKGYICKICEMFQDPKQATHADPSPFVGGTDLGDHPVRKLQKHQSSKYHEKALQRYIGYKSSDDIATAFKRKSDVEVTKNKNYMESLIDTVYLVTRKHWALDSVSDLMNHLKFQNCPAVSEYLTHSKVTYTSSTSVSDVLTAIGKFFEEKIITEINEAKYIALLADESTDEANRTQFSVLIRYLSDASIDDHFLGIIHVKKTDAATLMTELETFVLNKGINISKVKFIGFDGCNTMSGVNKGLQRRFRHKVPHSIYINCRSHRLALCVKHLIKDFPVLEEVDSTMLLIYKLFEYSPQKFAIFKDVQASYAVKELVMVRAAATRWLSHGNACKRIISRYVQIIDTLDQCRENTRDPQLTGLRNAIMSKKTTAAILILCDLLDPVNIFCKYLQGSVDFSTVSLKLKELIDTLTHLAEKFRATLVGPNDLQFCILTELFQEIDDRTVYARRMRGQNVFTREQIVEELAVPMVYRLIQELQDGFHCSPVLDAFSVFNLRNLPTTVQELTDYGNAAIETLTSHYGQEQVDRFDGHQEMAAPLFNKAQAIVEYQAFKHQMFMLRRRNPEDKTPLSLILRDPVLMETFPCMADLLLLGALIPTSTASVERSFSLMNQLCTVNRNRLAQETLTTLMQICREGSDTLSPNQRATILDNFKNMRKREIQL